MSGQLLVEKPSAARRDAPARPVHLHRRRPGAALRRPAHVRRAGGRGAGDAATASRARLAHIAIDPLDDAFDVDAFTAALRRRHTEVKRALLDQTLIGGVGNIYADEALWRARLHGARPTDKLTRAQVADLLDGVRDVLGEALAQGGTSFDSLYVDVNGQSGYFSRFLAVYGQADRPCPRCGTPIRRESFMNRSSYSCPTVPAARPRAQAGHDRAGGRRRLRARAGRRLPVVRPRTRRGPAGLSRLGAQPARRPGRGRARGTRGRRRGAARRADGPRAPGTVRGWTRRDEAVQGSSGSPTA